MLKRRLFSNLGANGFAQVVNVLVQLVNVPLFLYFWTKEQYGEWILLSSIPAYMSLAEAGFASVAANKISMLVAEGQIQLARRILHTAWGFLLAVSAGLLVLALLAAGLLPWNRLLHLHFLSGLETREVVFYLSVYTIIGLLYSIFGVVYRAAFRSPRVTFLLNFSKIAEIAVTAACICRSSSMGFLTAMLMLVRLATLGGIYWDTLGLSKELRLGISSFSWLEFKETIRPSLLFMAFPVGNSIYYQGLTLLVGTQLGAASVVTYNTTRTFTRIIVQGVSIVKASIWFEYSYLYGAGDLVKARRLNNFAFEGTLFFSVLGAAGLFFLAPSFMAVWTHHRVSVPPALLLLFLAGSVLNSVWSISSGFLFGVNRHEGLAWRYVAATGLAFAVSIICAPRLGLYGVALGMLVCEMALLPYAVGHSCAILGYSTRGLLRSTLRLSSLREGYELMTNGRHAWRRAGPRPGSENS